MDCEALADARGDPGVPANDYSIAWSARERNLTLWPSTPALGRGRVQRAALRGASAVWDDDDFGIMRGEAHLRYANRVTFQFEKCKPALARRVGHDACQTSRARRGKSRPAIPLASVGGSVCNRSRWRTMPCRSFETDMRCPRVGPFWVGCSPRF